MKVTKKLIGLSSVLFVIFAFQNCGLKATLKPVESLSLAQSGNGGGYEGKPDGTYYHFIPSYTCQGQPAAEQITEIKNGQAFLYDNKGNQCGAQSELIPMSDINVSPFQKEFISVKDSLFKKYEEKPVGIPSNLAEVLCRDDYENPTFEIVSHYDREKNEALTRVYLPTQQMADFSVSRLLSSIDVRYVANTLSFQVDLSKVAFPDRKYSGKIENSTIPGLVSQPLVCVIGGSIDTSKWALKTLTDRDVGGFRVMSNNEILFFSEFSRHYFSPTLFQTVTHLFKIGWDNVVTDFSSPVFGEKYDITSSIGKVSPDLHVFIGKLTSEMWTSMLLYDSQTGKSKRLTNIKSGADPEGYFLKTPVLTSNRHLVYDTHIIHPGMQDQWLIRSYNLDDETFTEIALTGPSQGGYQVLPKSNQVLIFWRNKNQTNNVIEIYDLKSKTSRDLPVSLPANCFVKGYNDHNTSDEKSIIALQNCGNDRTDVLQISLSNGSVKLIGADSYVSWASEDLNRFIITSSSKVSTAYDVRNGKSVPLPVDPHIDPNEANAGSTNFLMSQDSTKMALVNDRFLYGLGGKNTSPIMYQIDLVSGDSVPVCQSAVGQKLFLGALPNQKVFLFTYDASLKVFRFYQAKSPSECPRINEFPSESPNVPKLMPTQIGFGLLLGRPLTVTDSNMAAEAIFVPIDGRPPLKFNHDAKGRWQMEVSADRNRIVLQGPDAQNVMRIFSFDL